MNEAHIRPAQQLPAQQLPAQRLLSPTQWSGQSLKIARAMAAKRAFRSERPFVRFLSGPYRELYRKALDVQYPEVNCRGAGAGFSRSSSRATASS